MKVKIENYNLKVLPSTFLMFDYGSIWVKVGPLPIGLIIFLFLISQVQYFFLWQNNQTIRTVSYIRPGICYKLCALTNKQKLINQQSEKVNLNPSNSPTLSKCWHS